MAKKSTNGTPGGAAPRRPRTRKTTKTEPAPAPVDVASVTPVEPLETANDASRHAETPAMQTEPARPTYAEIARAAYLRYLGRGAQHGRDFDDWIEAERALTNSQT